MESNGDGVLCESVLLVGKLVGFKCGKEAGLDVFQYQALGDNGSGSDGFVVI